MDPRTFYQTVARRLDCDERHAETMAFIVLQQLRERLTTEAAAHVAAQLPGPINSMWQANERLHRPVEHIHRKELIERVRRWSCEPDVAKAERAVKVVFGALQELLGSPTGTEGEAWDVMSQLPKDLKLLWLEAGAHAAQAAAPSEPSA